MGRRQQPTRTPTRGRAPAVNQLACEVKKKGRTERDMMVWQSKAAIAKKLSWCFTFTVTAAAAVGSRERNATPRRGFAAPAAMLEVQDHIPPLRLPSSGAENPNNPNRHHHHYGVPPPPLPPKNTRKRKNGLLCRTTTTIPATFKTTKKTPNLPPTNLGQPTTPSRP